MYNGLQGPEAAPLSMTDSGKMYELITLHDEAERLFAWCPYICRTIRATNVFLFSPEEARQTHADGIAYRHNMSIGINSELIGGKYGNVWKMAYFHELTHLLCPPECGHSRRFHNLLDAILELYNHETGEELKNNYYGLEEKKCQSEL